MKIEVWRKQSSLVKSMLNAVESARALEHMLMHDGDTAVGNRITKSKSHLQTAAYNLDQLAKLLHERSPAKRPPRDIY